MPTVLVVSIWLLVGPSNCRPRRKTRLILILYARPTTCWHKTMVEEPAQSADRLARPRARLQTSQGWPAVL
jgi:hypothetical protein